MPPSTHSASSPLSRADFLIRLLGLSYLPKESGYIGILGRSCHNVTVTHQVQRPHAHGVPVFPQQASRPLAAQSHNYYMLTSEHSVNYLHFLEPDDTHILIEGGPVEYYTFTPPGHPSLVGGDQAHRPIAKKTIVGHDYLAGETPIISVPGGCWKALRLCEGVEFALTANVLAPEFTEDRVHIGAGPEFVAMFKGQAEWATEDFLRSLIANETWRAESMQRGS